MTAQYRAGNSSAGGNTSSQSCVVPATCQVGDLLLLPWVQAGTDFADGQSPPAGWTYLGETDSTHVSTMSIFLYSKICASGDIGATITRTVDSIRRHGVAVAAWYDDAGGALSVESAAFAASLTPPSAVSVAAQTFGVAGAGVRGGGGDPFTPPAGWVERIDQTTDVGSGGKNWTIADKLAYVAAGTNLGGAAFTNADTTQPASWVVVVKNTPAAVVDTSSGFLVL